MMATWRTLLASPQRKRMLATVATCTALLVGGLALLMLARNARTAAQQRLAAAEAATAEVQQRTAKLAPLVSDPNALARLHQRLQEIGVIGEPDRARWIGALRQTLDGGRWLQSRYLLGAGEDVPLPAASQEWIDLLGETTPTLRGQPLTLTLEGTHEVEVLEVMQRLRRSQAAGFEVMGCDFVRRDDAFGMDATCTLRWLSLAMPVVEAETTEPAP